MEVVMKADVPACLQLQVGTTLSLTIERTHDDWLVVKAKGVVEELNSAKIYGPPRFAIAALHAFLDSLQFPKVDR